MDVYSKSLPFVFPASYLLISTYIMSVSFVSFLLIIFVFVNSNMIVNPWASRFFPRKVFWAGPIVPTDYDYPKEFFPKCTNIAPGRRLLCLFLLAVITMTDLVSNLGLLQDRYFKKDIWSRCLNHRFLMNGDLNSSANKKPCVVLEASKIHLVKFDD